MFLSNTRYLLAKPQPVEALQREKTASTGARAALGNEIVAALLPGRQRGHVFVCARVHDAVLDAGSPEAIARTRLAFVGAIAIDQAPGLRRSTDQLRSATWCFYCRDLGRASCATKHGSQPGALVDPQMRPCSKRRRSQALLAASMPAPGSRGCTSTCAPPCRAGRPARPRPPAFFVSSDMNPAIQAADLCIYSINWGFRTVARSRDERRVSGGDRRNVWKRAVRSPVSRSRAS